MKTHPRLCAVALFNCFAVALLFFATAGLRAEETTAPIATTGDVTGLVVDADGEPVASISMEDFVNYRTYQGSPLLAARLGTSKRPVGTKTGAVSGLVVNAQGEPVAGAKVEIFVNCPMYQGSIREGTDEIHVVTGKDGVWHYAKMLRDIRAMEMSVSHNDYAMEREPWGLLTDCEQLQKMVFAGELKTVLKERLLHITGVVKDDTGKPLSGAEVYFLCRSPKVRYEGIPSKTDAAGRFDYSAAPNALSEFTIIAEGFALETRKVPVGTAPMELEFVLKPAAAIEGIVVDVDGNPIEEGFISIEDWTHIPRGYDQDNIRWNARSGSKSKNTPQKQATPTGHFSINNAPAEGLTGRFFRGKNYMQETIRLKPDAENKVVIRPATRVNINAVDAASGAPIKDYRVESTIFETHDGEEKMYGSSTEYVKENDGGIFHQTLNDPKREFIFTVLADGYMTAATARIKPDGTDRDIVLKLDSQDSRAFAVKVEDAQGLPAAGVNVTLVSRPLIAGEYHCVVNGEFYHLSPECAPLELVSEKGTKFPPPERKNDLKTAADGTVTVRPKAAQYTLVAAHPDKGFAVVDFTELGTGKPVVLKPWERIRGTMSALLSGTPWDKGRETTKEDWSYMSSLSDVVRLYSNEESDARKPDWHQDSWVYSEHFLTVEGEAIFLFSATAPIAADGTFELKHAVPKMNRVVNAREHSGETPPQKFVCVTSGKIATLTRIGPASDASARTVKGTGAVGRKKQGAAE